MNSFAEYAPAANPVTKKKDVVWFALNEDRPLFACVTLNKEFRASLSYVIHGWVMISLEMPSFSGAAFLFCSWRGYQRPVTGKRIGRATPHGFAITLYLSPKN